MHIDHLDVVPSLGLHGLCSILYTLYYATPYSILYYTQLHTILYTILLHTLYSILYTILLHTLIITVAL